MSVRHDAAATDIAVWAPAVDSVELALGPDAAHREPLHRADDGWWTWPGDPRGDGPFDYAFVVDGEGPFPDPRSAWQPHGVNGPSRWFDPSAHPWRDADWSGPRGGAGALGGVIYELHIGTFTPEGTLAAAMQRLDHLVDLGVDVVELMPVAAFPGRWGWGYDGVLPYAVHDQYGGPAALQAFVDECHARGLGVCLDVVHNHLGPSGNHLARFGPYFTHAHSTPWGPAVNLDQPGSDGVRRWIVDNVVRWLRDFHLDALRLDAVHELVDTSPRHVLAEISDAVAGLEGELGRPLTLIAESDLNDTVMITPTGRGGLGMSAQWADDVHHALHVVATGELQGYYADFGGGTQAWPDGGPMSVLAKVLGQVFLHDGRMSTFRGRPWGAPVDPEQVPAARFVAYLQTHDQVGNRATGDRISAGVDPARQAAAAALYLLSPFTPMIFMGEEWGASTPFCFFSDFDDPALAEAVRTGRRAEFAAHGWAAEDIPDPQDEATRDASVLRWDESVAGHHARLLAHHRALIALRRRLPAAERIDDVTIDFDETDRWIALSRKGVVVVAAFGDGIAEVPVATFVGGLPGAELLGWGERRVDGGVVRLDGPGVSVLGRVRDT
ncbi:malto-oligosyltrehalose trehalohydrolase [Janibacter sp. G1551]|uniref:malto-oligosyltrehalose trehalohydrolase n=1 Tax=Janibacter sp. G1551 TaxID=3420440 RepID=UPI003D01DFCE